MDSSPLRYMYCEVHKGKLLQSRKGAKNPYSSNNEFVPAFYCDECNRYYINATHNGVSSLRYTGTIMPKSQVKIYTTVSKVYNRHPETIKPTNPTHKFVRLADHLIDDLFLPIRTYSILIKAGIFTYSDLYIYLKGGIDSMLEIEGLSPIDISEIVSAVKNIAPDVAKSFRTNNKEHGMYCPVHENDYLTTTDIIFDFLAPEGGYSYFFFCTKCRRYYFKSRNSKEGTYKTSRRTVNNGIEVWATDNAVCKTN